jgi:hypothetical protein
MSHIVHPSKYSSKRAFRAAVESQPIDALRDLIQRGELELGEDREVTLFDDGRVRVIANPRASHGYCYITAYLS